MIKAFASNKKIITFICLLTALLLLCSCEQGKEKPDNAKYSVTVTDFPAYDTVRAVITEDFSLEMLLTPGTDPHGFEPTPKDMKAVTESDLFVYIGGPSDAWAENFVKNNKNALALIDKVEKKYVHHEDEHDEHEHEHGHEEYDEHIWTDPNNVIKMTDAVCEQLCRIAPECENALRENAKKHIDELVKLDKEIKETVEKHNIKILVFGDRFPFLYFTERYGIEHYSAFPGCSHETEPSPKMIAQLTEKVKEEHISTVFRTQMSNPKIAQTIANAAGADTAVLHSCGNISADEFKRGETYISLMRQNIKTLAEAYPDVND